MTPARRDPRQGDLFGDPQPRPSRGAIEPAVVSEDLLAVASRLPESIRLGTSSWSFPGWQGIVYARAASEARLARAGLEAYARHPLLRTVGVDRTYYAPVPAATYAGYAAAVREGFRFLVKAPEQCTAPRVRDESGGSVPNPSYLDPGFAAQEVVAPLVEGLKEKAGPLVFQFPPQGARVAREPARFAERLGAFLRALPRGPWYAVEVRDSSLLCEDLVDAIGSAGASVTLSLHPRMPAVDEQYARAGIDSRRPLVVRWMLARSLDYEGARTRYAPFGRLVDEDVRTRASLADLAIAHAEHDMPVFVVANNKAEGCAPLTVFRLAEEIAARLPPRE